MSSSFKSGFEFTLGAIAAVIVIFIILAIIVNIFALLGSKA